MPYNDKHNIYAWFGVATTLMAGTTLVAYLYFQQSSSPNTETNPQIAQITDEVGDDKLAGLQMSEIIDEITAQFPIITYKSQLVEQQQRLQTKFKSSDLVERIALNIELKLLKIKIDNDEQLYSEKILLLFEAYQSLKNLKDAFSSQDYLSAQAALIKGNTSIADELFSQIESKGRNARERNEINRAAEAAYQRGKIAEEQIDNRKAYRHYRQAVIFSPNNVRYLLEAGQVANNIALYNNAINFYEAALHIQLKEKGKSSNEFRQIWTNLGSAWNSKGNADKAIEYFELALVSDLEKFGKQHHIVAEDKNNLGWAWETKGRLKKAIRYYQQALKINNTALGLAHPVTLQVKENLEAATQLSSNNSTR